MKKHIKKAASVKKPVEQTKKELERRTQELQRANEKIKSLYKELDKKTEDLKRLDQLKSEFVSTASHELRTPLAAIKESVMLILDGTAGKTSSAQSRFLGIARRNIDRLTDLINDLLDIFKIDTGKLQLKKSKCDINVLINKTLEQLKSLASDNKLILNQVLAKDLPKVECDQGRIIQVITNLVGNAIKFTPSGGKIMIISKKRDTKFIEISVTDTGIGIDKKDISKLFTRFRQLDSSLTRKVGGTGLGLAICREIIQMHGGKIWAKSEVGKGSVFVFTLPVLSEKNIT
ncbi:MAG: hypothetical protein KJ793_00280 [Candidatus Omnitrophica bacterium]|nr:hypothetical protein [Candidatus Omnitrophota bacterium]